MNALRLNQPTPISLFEDRTGLLIQSIEETLQRAQQKGLLNWQNSHIEVSEMGHRYLNDLLEMFMLQKAVL